MMKMMATMMVITIVNKMMMRCMKNKLMNTFSRKLDFVFINLVISYKCSHLLYMYI